LPGGQSSFRVAAQGSANGAKTMLAKLCVLCGTVFHKNYILTAMAAAGSGQTQLPLRTPGPPDTHSSTRYHKSACQPPHLQPPTQTYILTIIYNQ